MDFGTITGQGEFCFNVDVAGLGVAGVANGSVATIQVEFNGGDGTLFQCADVVLRTDFAVPANVTCANSTSAAVVATTSASAGAGASQTLAAASNTATGTAPSATASKTSAGGQLVGGGAVAAVLALVGAVVLA